VTHGYQNKERKLLQSFFVDNNSKFYVFKKMGFKSKAYIYMTCNFMPNKRLYGACNPSPGEQLPSIYSFG
jgi:hypothetical protein